MNNPKPVHRNLLVVDLCPHLDQFGEGLVDENEGDKEGEDLLSETGDKANQDASLEGHSEENDEHQPETDPHPACQVLDLIVFTKLHRNTHQVRFREPVTEVEVMQGCFTKIE